MPDLRPPSSHSETGSVELANITRKNGSTAAGQSAERPSQVRVWLMWKPDEASRSGFTETVAAVIDRRLTSVTSRCGPGPQDA